jgi:hypothetical protein
MKFIYSSGENWLNQTGDFVVPRKGKFRITCTIITALASPIEKLLFSFNKNSTSYDSTSLSGIVSNAVIGNYSITTAGTVACEAGDIIRAWVHHSSTISLTTTSVTLIVEELLEQVPYLVANGNGVVSDPRQGYVSINNYLTMKVNGIFSSDNHNLIDNPDFAINQREKSTYDLDVTVWTYTFDRWRFLGGNFSLSKVDGGIQLTRNSVTIYGYLSQCLETKDFLPSSLTLSVSVGGVVYSFTTVENLSSKSISFNVKTKIFSTLTVSTVSEIMRLDFNDYGAGETTPVINWVKLEAGYAATPFVKPNFATEMYKCQRYLAPISIVSEIVVKDSETILSKFFHLRSLSSYGVYNPGNYSFYLKSLDGLTISAGVLPTSFLRFYNSTEGNIRVMIRPLFPAGMGGVNNMNITPNAGDSIVTEPNPAQPVLLIAEI